jgi:hypothetical protein
MAHYKKYRITYCILHTYVFLVPRGVFFFLAFLASANLDRSVNSISRAQTLIFSNLELWGGHENDGQTVMGRLLFFITDKISIC